MTAKLKFTIMSKHNFYGVDAEITRQTIQESEIDYSIDMGAFTIHHGTREGGEIVIAEHHNQKSTELSAIWFDENK